MKSKLIQNKIIVRKSSLHGYGVFASKKIRKNEIIEQCYMLLSRGGDRGLEDYYFDAKGKHAIFTGYGSIYNHAEDPNADYTFSMKKRIATIKANQTIQKDEEISVSYGNGWFKDRGLKVKSEKRAKKK
jgi:SET domain-containing protein